MALAMTSFPAPFSPWIEIAEWIGAALSTSVSNARNLGLDQITSEVAIALLLYACEICSVLASDQTGVFSVFPN
jgi:hypothetical protein